MSYINMQDNVIKANLVQQVQLRGAEAQRAAEKSQHAFTDELARKADETVTQTTEAENEGIRDELEEKPESRQQRRRRRHPEDRGEDDDEEAPPSDGESHLIDITI